MSYLFYETSIGRLKFILKLTVLLETKFAVHSKSQIALEFLSVGMHSNSIPAFSIVLEQSKSYSFLGSVYSLSLTNLMTSLSTYFVCSHETSIDGIVV
jgi:hypothetical protein